MPLTLTWGWDLAWGGSGGRGSPLCSASSLGRLFVHLSCLVPPHKSLVLTEVEGLWSASAGPQPHSPFSCVS